MVLLLLRLVWFWRLRVVVLCVRVVASGVARFCLLVLRFTFVICCIVGVFWFWFVVLGCCVTVALVLLVCVCCILLSAWFGFYLFVILFGVLVLV